LSNWDKNTFSSLDDNDNNGYGFHLENIITPNYNRINPKLRIYYRKLSKNLNTFARIPDVVDVYELQPLPDSLGSEEYYSLFSFDFFNKIKPDFLYKKKIISDYAEQNYLSFSTSISQHKFLPQTYYRTLHWDQSFRQGFLNENQSFLHDIKMQYNMKHVSFQNDVYWKSLISKYEDKTKFGEQNFIWKTKIGTIGFKEIASDIFYQEEKADSLNSNDKWEKANITHSIGTNITLNKQNQKLRSFSNTQEPI